MSTKTSSSTTAYDLTAPPGPAGLRRRLLPPTLYAAGLLAALAPCSHVWADDTAPTMGETPANVIIVTGTRQSGVKAEDSVSPVQIIDAAALEKSGQPDLLGALAQLFPSFQAQAAGGDTAALTLTARLRGLSPNDTLILIDGKRRHGTANLSVDRSAFQGAATADLSFIPLSAVDHIEVLTDGAAAQYGTDAIAGVINIILKKDDSGGSVSALTGRYVDGGGNTGDLSVNGGLPIGQDGFINVTGESKYHGFSIRSGPDPRVLEQANLTANPVLLTLPDYPVTDLVLGDSAYQLDLLTINTGYDFNAATHGYAFITLGKKDGATYENYRLPSVLPQVYPLGFSPQETINENDYALTVGVKGKLTDTWNYDASSTYGADVEHVGNINSVNVDLYHATGASPTSFHIGDYVTTQWTQNLDLSRDINVGWATPLNFATGLEFREESYEIGAGDAASTFAGGAAAFPGLTSTDAGRHTRNNSALYIDLAGSPIRELKLDAAARYEHYSDFGKATVGKLSGRYDFNPVIAVRGTVSSGFRAPTLAEEYYSATNVTPDSAFVQLPPNSPGATLIGVDGLKPEKSKNYSLGVIAKPTTQSSLSLDAYQIDISNRIVGSGSLYGLGGAINSPAVNAAITANGNFLDYSSLTFAGVSVFTNAASTSTKGVDLLYTLASKYESYGHVDWSISGSYNSTSLTSINQIPQQLQPQALIGPTTISNLTESAPQYAVDLGALWKLGAWEVNAREDVYGPSSEQDTINGATYYQVKINTKAITDLDISNHLTKSLTVTLGATNLFNQYPTKVNADLLAEANKLGIAATAVRIYPAFSPFGINGGFYYAKLTYRW